LAVDVSFRTQLPRVFARTGFAGDFHMVAQWYPKLGVLEEEHGWRAHVFSVRSEFYADFGNYRVEIDVPEHMTVGATGVRLSEALSAGRKRVVYAAEMVHDFAWVAHSAFHERFGRFRDVQIRQLVPPEHLHDADLHLDAQTAAFAAMESRFGPYPWSTLTIVHAPRGAEGAGGMEYPTLYTTWDRPRLPPWLRLLADERVVTELTTLHEFAHQYFQGILASNEHVEPWLDEGMATLASILVLHDRYGPDPWVVRLFGHELHADDYLRLGMRLYAPLDPIDQPADAFANQASFARTVYERTAAAMLTLRNLAGPAAFDRALRTYAETMRFRHPTGRSLRAALVDGLGSPPGDAKLDVGRYLEDVLGSTREVDFRVVRVENLPSPGAAGWHRNADGKLVGGDPPRPPGGDAGERGGDGVDGEALIQRVGDLAVPVDIVAELADKTRERRLWDGRARHHRLSFPGKRLLSVTVDPGRKLVLESRRADNTGFADGAAGRGELARVLGDLAETIGLVILALPAP
jgi:hypothetical protein